MAGVPVMAEMLSVSSFAGIHFMPAVESLFLASAHGPVAVPAVDRLSPTGAEGDLARVSAIIAGGIIQIFLESSGSGIPSFGTSEPASPGLFKAALAEFAFPLEIFHFFTFVFVVLQKGQGLVNRRVPFQCR
jgi:hypothetical protein